MTPISDKQKAELLAGPYTRLLAEHEGAMADFYRILAGLLPEGRAFWEQMSREELSHKELVLKMGEKFQAGEWKFRRPGFLTSAIVDSLSWLASRKVSLETQGISMREALKVSLLLESGMIESSFFVVQDGDSAEMMEMLQTQTAYTKAHMLRIKKEAGRFKWRITGGRRARLTKPDGSMSRENLQASIKASQSNMLGLLISMEEAINRLYVAYSGRFKEAEKFWGKIAAEELQHAAMLRQLYKILDKGQLFYSIDHFARPSLEKMIEVILNAEYDVHHKLITLKMAISMAIQTEMSITECGFYRTVKSDAPEYQIIAEQMVKRTEEHITRLKEEQKNQEL